MFCSIVTYAKTPTKVFRGMTAWACEYGVLIVRDTEQL